MSMRGNDFPEESPTFGRTALHAEAASCPDSLVALSTALPCRSSLCFTSLLTIDDDNTNRMSGREEIEAQCKY